MKCDSRMIHALFFLIWAGPAQAAPGPVREDFAYGQELVIPRPDSVVQFPIPEAAFSVSTRPDWTDLGVFNSRNEPVPHVLVNPEPAILEKTETPVKLTVFPVYGNEGGDKAFEQVRITQSGKGSTVEFKNGANPRAGKKRVGYLIDATRAGKDFQKIRFTLDGATRNAFIRMKIESSRDFKSWDLVEPAAVLGQFEVEGETLIKNEVSLAGSKDAYLRLSLQGETGEVSISAAEAVFAPSKERLEEALQWIKAVEKDPNADVHVYDLGGYYPISGISVRFADPNSTARLEFEASNREEGPWVPVGSAGFYSVVREGATFSKLETGFNESAYRFWRIRLSSSRAGVGSRFPEMAFGWRAKLLRFMARGEGPFVFAYGSGATTLAPHPDLIDSDRTKPVTVATLRDRIELGGKGKLVRIEKTELPWKKTLLWGVLILGVILLGAMALQVRKQEFPES